MILDALAANAFPGTSGIRTITVIEVTFFATFHSIYLCNSDIQLPYLWFFLHLDYSGENVKREAVLS